MLELINGCNYNKTSIRAIEYRQPMSDYLGNGSSMTQGNLFGHLLFLLSILAMLTDHILLARVCDMLASAGDRVR